MDDEEPHRWTWRNTRSIGVSVSILVFPWDWFVGAVKDFDDHTQYWGRVQIGPIGVCIRASIGNCSTGDWRARFGLSETEAWERAGR